MIYNMDWLRTIIDKLYLYLSELPDYELFEVFCILIISLVAWGFLPSLPDMIRYLRRSRKEKSVSQKTLWNASTETKTVTLPNERSRTSTCSQKDNTISSSIPQAFSEKPELDIKELKKMLNMK